MYRYMRHRSMAQEREQIADWLEADEKNRAIMDRMSIEMETLALLAPELNQMHVRLTRRRGVLRQLARWSAAAAAALALCAGTWYVADTSVRRQVAGKMLTFRTQNAPVQYTLSDGTQVWLNAGTRLEYPAAFTGRERRVHVDGEALFEVTHEAGHPFIVETFACRVEVLGTRFNVQADEASGTFSTALLEGRVALTSNLTGERLTLAPDDYACLEDGRLSLRRLRSRDDYLWTEGILSIGGSTFPEVMRRLEKTYGVRIVIERTPAPTLHVARGRIWASMGLDYVLRTLQDVSTFRYEIDEQTNTVYIR